MSGDYQLSNGALHTIMKGGKVEDAVMQVLGSKRIPSGSDDKERFRMLLSDGKYLISFAMLTIPSSETGISGELPNFTVIKIKRYITSVVQTTGKRILILLDKEVMCDGNIVGKKIGDPIPIPDDDKETESKSDSGPPPAKRPNLSSASSSNTNLNTTVLSDQLSHPISSLSPYQNKWIIKARVTNKSAIRTWSNSRGEGKLFSMDLVDESGEIRVTAFRDLVDKYYDMIQIDKVYYISKCQLKVANKQFSSLKNDYEMTLNSESVIQECHDEDESIPRTQYNFIAIEKIANMNAGDIVDTIAVCKQASDVQTIIAKATQKELRKRELTLIDMSKTSITLTIWGADAENYNMNVPVVAIKGARINEFAGGKSLGGINSTLINYNPDIPEAARIRGWYDNGGGAEEVQNISARSGSNMKTEWLSFGEVRDNNLGNAERGDYFQTKGTVLLVRSENSFYKACPIENCNKKVVDMSNGQYRCEKCNMEYPNFKYRLLGNLNVGDWSGNQWISLFTTEAETVLGKTAQEVGESAETNKENVATICNEAHFKQFIFKCRVKMEKYNDENRLKTVAMRVEPVNYKEYNTYLISKIKELTS